MLHSALARFWHTVALHLCQASSAPLPRWKVSRWKEASWFVAAGAQPLLPPVLYTPFGSVSGLSLSFCLCRASTGVWGHGGCSSKSRMELPRAESATAAMPWAGVGVSEAGRGQNIISRGAGSLGFWGATCGGVTHCPGPPMALLCLPPAPRCKRGSEKQRGSPAWHQHLLSW